MKKIALCLFAFFCVLCTHAQEAGSIQQKLATFAGNSLQEKVFVHIDKNSYVAGEIMWFKIYNVDASAHIPLDLNKVAYLEVLNNKNLPVLQTKIELNEGTGNGSLNLPTYLSSGYYTVRCYTNWMKNFKSDYFFEKPIVIINALKLPDSTVNAVVRSASVRFFPEGGNLVAGIRSKVAFRMAGMDDRGLDCDGILLNADNDTVASFRSLKFGIGSFQFTPVSGSKYRAVIKSNDGRLTLTQDLPVIQVEGFVMKIMQSTPEQLSIDVQARGSDKQTGEISLLVHSRHIVKNYSTTQIRNGAAGFTINTSVLPDGISHFTIFRNGSPVSERLYFKKPANQLRLEISTDAPHYSERNKVTLGVSAMSDNKPEVASLSLSVFRTDSLQDAGIENFRTYLLLNGDLRGRIDSADYYFSNEGQTSTEALDNVMLTHGWTRFTWDEVLGRQTPALPFVHEQTGHIITGKITNVANGAPQSDVVTYLSTPSRYIRLNGDASNSNGEFNFITRDFFGHNEIIVQAPSTGGTPYRIDVNSPFSEAPASRKFPVLQLSPSLEQSLQAASIGMQVQQVFYEKENRQFLMPDTDTSSFYGAPDQSFWLDDYTRFTTIEEILREYVPQVNVRKQNGKFRLQMYDGENRILNYDPLLLVDGVPVFDVDRFMSMDPLKLSKLEVIPNTYFLGSIRADGIASFTSYNGDMGEVEPDPGALVIDYEGLQVQREFYSPDYSVPELLNSRLPDFRNVLYWKPDLITDTSGKTTVAFYTSNQPGQYRVVIHGITNDGKAFTGFSSFVVKPAR